MARKAHDGDEKNIKSVRWKEILRLIRTEEIGTQQDLAARLQSEGYNVTQATVSRDIKELGLIKSAKEGGGYKYETSAKPASGGAMDKFRTMCRSEVKGAEDALNQVVIRCNHGMANAVCAAMDMIDWEGFLGSIAGDDTILVIFKSEVFAQNFKEKIKAL